MSRARSFARRLLRIVLPGRSYAHVLFLLKHPRYYPKLRGSLSIDGWLGHAEAVNLFNAARSIEKKDPAAVEIGCWQGKSTVVVGKAWRSRPNARIACIDPFNGEAVTHGALRVSELRESGGTSLKEVFRENLRKNQLERMVQIIEGYSFEAVKDWASPIDLLFIDGNHEYEAVRRDFDDWTPFLVRGGILVMDDVGVEGRGHPGPSRVAGERIFNSGEWKDIYIIGRHLVARKS